MPDEVMPKIAEVPEQQRKQWIKSQEGACMICIYGGSAVKY
jgi:hypothetical protein